MKKIKNLQNISRVIMRPFAECKCAIGRDWYHIDFEIVFIPRNYYPDYMDTTDFISKNINGRELNIEEAVDVIFEHLRTYEPMGLSVTANVESVTTHFPVSVTKSEEWEL